MTTRRVEIRGFMQSASGAILALPVDDKIQPFKLTALEILQYKIVNKGIIIWKKKFRDIYDKDFRAIYEEAAKRRVDELAKQKQMEESNEQRGEVIEASGAVKQPC